MRVLLTGASGFLGANLLERYLADTDWEFVCPVSFRHRGTPERIVWALDGADSERVDVVVHDCATPVNPVTAARFGDIDLVLNLASETHPPRSVLQPVEFVHNNVDLTLYLLEYARTHGKPTFVQFSTNSVYGPAFGAHTHPEWDPIIPNNPYGASKAAQEALAISYWRSYRLPVLIVATMNPIGLTQDPEKFVPMTIGKALSGETVEIHVDGQGRPGTRAYIDSSDVADGLLHILTRCGPPLTADQSDRPERWNVANIREVNNYRVLQLIDEALGTNTPHEFVNVDRPEHGHRYSMSGAKLSAAGWSPGIDVENTIRHIAKWTAEHREWLAR